MSVLVLCLLLVPSLAMMSAMRIEDTNSLADESEMAPPQPSTILTSHTRIYIDGNASFATQASAEGWPGNGTQGNPYVIHGYDIDGTGWWGSIYVRNTDVWFVISNCRVFGGNCGIHLENVTMGTVVNNTCFDTTQWGGVLLESSHNNTVRNNSCLNNIEGVWIHNSINNQILDNNCSLNRIGIRLTYSRDNVISNNTCWSNDNGMEIDSSYDNTILDNSYLSSYSSGILIKYAGVNTFVNNTMVNDGVLIYGDLPAYLAPSFDETNTVNGRPLFYGKNMTSGTVPEGVGQVILANCTNVTVADLNLSMTTVGIQLGFCSDIRLLGNNCSSNTIGARLEFSTGRIAGNNISSNRYCGMLMDSFTAFSIEENWFVDNIGYAIRTYSNVSQDVIWNNTFIDNNLAGDPYSPVQSQAFDCAFGTKWNDSYGHGNRWSDWTGPDANMDGIVDVPYTIGGSPFGDLSKDYYPYAEPAQITEFGMMPLVVMVLLTAIVLTIGARRRKA